MKIAAYCRVSTDKTEQLTSLHHQKTFFTAYAQRSGHDLVKVYADEGISGTSLKKREAFLQLMEDAKTGLFQMVVVKDVSRFARNTVDALQSIRQLKSLGINTLFLTANMDAMGDSEFVLTLFSAMAQEESANISKRTKFGKRINAEKGRVPRCVFGYDRVDNFTLAINAREADIVRRIFGLYQQGLGCRTISAMLNAEGALTKFQNQWESRGIRRILTNPLYCGILVNHKYEIEDFLTGHQIALPPSQQFTHERPEWAIISPEVFQKTQEILASRRTKYDSGEPFRQGRHSGKHLFSTLIQCTCCGRSFCRKTYTYVNTRTYWRCSTNDQYTAKACDNRVCVEESELLAAIRTYFLTLIGDSSAFTERLLTALASRLPQSLSLETEEKRSKLRVKQERYQELYANDLISLDDLRKRLAVLRQESDRLDATPSPGASLLVYRQQAEAFLTFQTLTNADLRQILDRILVSPDGTVQIRLKTL